MNDVIISLQNVTRIYQMGEYQLFALNDVNLDIYKNEFLTVLGPSGSGKSTLLNMIGGMDRPTHGKIIIGQQDIATASDRKLTIYRRNKIGFIFQFFNLLPTLTALENVEVAIEIAKNPLDPLEVLEMVELTKFMHHFPAQLSGGQQQRVAIARALVSNPDVLLCDEPTGALDSKTSKIVLQILINSCKKLQKNIVMITHNQKLAKLGNRTIKLKDGKIEDIISQTPIGVDEIQW
ncbi:MAG: ABC transporter ATP-binding protein [Gammaproteobacteria bacterium]|jgi:putative ABC transport system ATP-binding protein